MTEKKELNELEKDIALTLGEILDDVLAENEKQVSRKKLIKKLK